MFEILIPLCLLLTSEGPPPAQPAHGEAKGEAAKKEAAPPRKAPEPPPAGKSDKAEGRAAAHAPGRPGDKPATEKPPGERPVPPTLTGTAFRQELSQGKRVGDLEHPPSERERMQNLAADLARTREALRAETARLEALIRQAPAEAGRPVGSPATGAAPPAPLGLGPPGGRPVDPSQVELVAKTFRGMKPEQAAALIGHLDRALAAEVLARMRPPDAGAILGLLRPELGAALTTEMANRPAAAGGGKKKAEKGTP